MTRTSQSFIISVSDGESPSWYTSALDKQWINVRLASGQGEQLQNIVGGNTLNIGGQFGGYPGDQHIVGTWNGAIQLEDHYAIICAGGHKKTSDNGVYVFGPFNSETPTWRMVIPPEEGLTEQTTGPSYTSSGRPVSRHTYNHVAYISNLGGGVGHQWFAMRAGAVFGASGNSHRVVDTFNFGTDPMVGGSFDPAGTNPNWPQNLGGASTGGCAYDSVNERVYATGGSGAQGDSRYLFEFNPYTRTWTQHGSQSTTNGIHAIVDTARRLFIILDADGSPNEIGVWDLSANNFADYFDLTPSGTLSVSTPEPGLAYDPIGGDVFMFDGGSDLYRLVIPNDYRNGGTDTSQPITNTNWSWQQVTGITGTAPSSPTAGTFGKFGYIESLRAFAAQNGIDDDMYVFKIPESGL